MPVFLIEANHLWIFDVIVKIFEKRFVLSIRQL